MIGFVARPGLWCLALALTLPFLLVEGVGFSQEPTIDKVRRADTTRADVTGTDGDQLSSAATKIDVRPGVRDDEILARLRSVLDATGQFQNTEVRVTEGVVFLEGQVDTEDLKDWASDLAQNTQDVVAVLNRIEVADPSIWDFRPAWLGLVTLWRDVVRSLPFIAFGLLVLALATTVAILILGPRGLSSINEFEHHYFAMSLRGQWGSSRFW